MYRGSLVSVERFRKLCSSRNARSASALLDAVMLRLNCQLRFARRFLTASLPTNVRLKVTALDAVGGLKDWSSTQYRPLFRSRESAP